MHLLLFAARESVQESLGFSLFELIFGHSVRGPLKLLKEQWLTDEQPSNLLTYVCRFREKLTHACEIAMSNLKQAQGHMKARYDRNTELRKFEPGDEVLLFLPVPGHPLTAKYYGPYEVEKMENELNYVVKTPDRRKPRQRCHINMMKQYHKRDKVHVAARSYFVYLTIIFYSEVSQYFTDLANIRLLVKDAISVLLS